MSHFERQCTVHRLLPLSLRDDDLLVAAESSHTRVSIEPEARERERFGDSGQTRRILEHRTEVHRRRRVVLRGTRIVAHIERVLSVLLSVVASPLFLSFLLIHFL